MRVLLTGARAPATLELARLGARAGHEVHVADTDRWHVCRGSRLISGCHVLPAPRDGHAAYAQALRALVERCGVALVVPTCEEVFHLAALHGQIGATIACEPLSRLAPLHDKARFVDACRDAGVPAPVTHPFTTAAELSALPYGDYILKPRYSRFATRVHRWTSGTRTPELGAPRAGGWIAQRFVRGASVCTWSTSHRGALLAHATYAVDATAGVRGAAVAFHSIRHAAVRFWVETFLAHHRLSGQFAFDFIDGDDGLHAIECNPRLTSGVHCFRAMPDVTRTLFTPQELPVGDPMQPPLGTQFRSRLALALYDHPHRSGAGLLDADDDPWPRRLQAVTWTHLLLRALVTRTDPRLLSTRDIEWNGE